MYISINLLRSINGNWKKYNPDIINMQYGSIFNKYQCRGKKIRTFNLHSITLFKHIKDSKQSSFKQTKLWLKCWHLPKIPIAYLPRMGNNQEKKLSFELT